jgi:glycosyltransferase involved in cell wall biosynthesis
MFNEGVVRIASVGRLERYKGHHRVLSALPYVLAEEPNLELWIAGMGPYEDALRELAARLGVADHVTIQSNSLSDRDAMAAQLAECALVVLLSEYETHPMAALEAAALGRPLLVADTSGLHELVVDGIARSVPVNADPQRIARAILDQLARPLVPDAIDLPTWDDCAHALLGLYRSIHMRRNGR